MSKRKSRHFFNFDEDTSDLYSDIDTKTLVDDVKSKEHLSTTEFFLSNRLESKVNSLRYENINVDVSDKDVRKFFDGKIAKKMNSSRSNMIEEIKNTFINSILVYTGLTAVDLKNIGNVQTSHNMNKNNYVSEDLKYDRNDYDDPYKRKKFKNSRRHDDGSCVDAYTGKRTYSPETDHITSLKDFHNNVGFMIDDKSKSKNIINHDDNIDITDGRTNESKGGKSLDDTLNNKNFRERHGINKKLATNAVNKSLKHIKKYTKYVKPKYYSTNMAKDGLKQGTNALKSAMLGKGNGGYIFRNYK